MYMYSAMYMYNDRLKCVKLTPWVPELLCNYVDAHTLFL